MCCTKIIRTMIVEDYKLARIAIRYALQSYKDIDIVSEADNGEEAIREIRILKPDIVLLDLGLPRKNGFEIIAQIHNELPDIKFIALTSHDRQDEVLCAMNLGFSAYVLKDSSVESLYFIIKNVYSGACWLDSKISNYVLNSIPKQVDYQQYLKNQPDKKIKLTEREREVLRLIMQGKTNPEIAKELVITIHTAKAHVCNILQKYQVTDRIKLVIKALSENNCVSQY